RHAPAADLLVRRLSSHQLRDEPAQRKLIAERPPTDHDPGRNRGDDRVMTERLARMHVREVHLYHWRGQDRGDGIANRVAVVGERAGVEYDAIVAVACLVDPVDEDAFVVVLAELDAAAELLGHALHSSF